VHGLGQGLYVCIEIGMASELPVAARELVSTMSDCHELAEALALTLSTAATTTRRSPGCCRASWQTTISGLR
jgi:hypothetical protein